MEADRINEAYNLSTNFYKELVDLQLSGFRLENSERDLLGTNSFGLLRLTLATTVLFQHSLVLSGNGHLVFFGYFKEADLGSTGVGGFFAVSGFLLAGSAQRLAAREFFIHRIFRLIPGLWFALVISAFVIVPVSTFFSPIDSDFTYFAGDNSSFFYVLRNAGLIVFQDSIGNVFENNPYPLAVNGSLWTLAPEFICYLSLLFLAIITRRKDFIQKVSLVFAIIAASIVWLVSENSVNPVLIAFVHPASGLGIAFATGSLLAFIVKELPYRPKPFFAIMLLGIWLMLGFSGPFAMISLAVIVVSLGLSLTNPAFSKIGRKTDISYGIYLFHFPAIQAVILCTTITWTSFASLTILPAVTLLIAAPLAWISWRFIENPSISFARGVAPRQP
jgi:peptidoglycan/LPS O-acetylase OafA/YrhL